MFKRFAFLTVVFLLVCVAPLALTQSACDFSYSNYARAVQLHDMGDYVRALHHYDCAMQADPDHAIIPILIENVHEDIANASRAWSGASESQTQSECDFSYSNYARAVQLHDMGDYVRALHHYDCAMQADPDHAIIPILIENVHEDIANSSRAWSSASESLSELVCDPARDHGRLGAVAHGRGDDNQALIDLQCVLLVDPNDVEALSLMGQLYINRGDTHTAQHYFDRAYAARVGETDILDASPENDLPASYAAPSEFVMPDWLTPYETMPSVVPTAPVQPIVIFTDRSRVLVQTEHILVIADDDTLTTWRRLQQLYVEQVKLVISTGEMTLTLYAKRVYALSVEATVTLKAADTLASARENARQASRRGDFDDAIKWMRQVTAADVATADDHAYLAYLYSMQGDMKSVARALSKALELEPTRLDIRCNLGMAYSAQGEYPAAFGQFQRVISQKIGDICANENWRALTRQPNAANNETIASEIQVTSPAQEIFEHGMKMLSARKLYAAANTFLEALALDSNHGEARCQLGAIYTEWANYGGALAQFDRILADDPQSECAREYRKVAVLDMLAMYIPLTVDDFFYHARTFVRVEEWELARDAFQRGLEIDPTRMDVRCELGMIYAQLGDDHAALNEFSRATAQDVVDLCAWSNLEALLKRLR